MFKPNFRRTDLLIEMVTRIEVARDRILRAPIVPRWEAALRREALVRSAHHSTSIEGNPLSLEEVTDFNGEWFMAAVKSIGEDFGLKGRELWHPIRAAIAGRVVGPDMVTIVETFGLDKCRERIRAALASA